MMVVLCNQHGWDDMNDFTYGQMAPRILALWDQLAAMYQDTDPEKLLFEVINEPPTLLSRSKTRLLMQEAVEVIRRHTSEHTIVLSGALGSHASELPNTSPLADTNIIYTFHYYEPFYFTHQGASWTPIYFPVGATFPSGFLNDENIMRNQFDRIDDWRQLHQVPVYLGELGTINFGDEGSKCNWIGLVGELIDQYDLNWSYWDCKFSTGDRFGFFDGDTISPFSIRQCYRQALHLYDDGPPTSNAANVLNELSMSPNPARDRFTLTGLPDDRYQVSIHDIAGRQIMRLDGIHDRSEIAIDLLPPGIYVVTLSQRDALVGVARLVKSQ
jgi:hypothetical protein